MLRCTSQQQAGDYPCSACQEPPQRLEREAPGVSQSIPEGLYEILTDNRLSLPPDLRRSLAFTNIIESMKSIICQVCRNVKRWRNAKMELRWTTAGVLEAKKGFKPCEEAERG